MNFYKAPSSTKPTTSAAGTLNFESNSLNAEILWCLNMVNQHLSYNSCSHVSELFSAMFLTVKLYKSFQWGKPKVDIWLSMAWPPTSKKKLLKKINFSFFYYSVSFDESFNSELQKCQMDINVCYWDTKNNIAVTCYFDSVFLDRPNASNLLDSLQESTKPIPDAKISSVSNGWP